MNLLFSKYFLSISCLLFMAHLLYTQIYGFSANFLSEAIATERERSLNHAFFCFLFCCCCWFLFCFFVFFFSFSVAICFFYSRFVCCIYTQCFASLHLKFTVCSCMRKGYACRCEWCVCVWVLVRWYVFFFCLDFIHCSTFCLCVPKPYSHLIAVGLCVRQPKPFRIGSIHMLCVYTWFRFVDVVVVVVLVPFFLLSWEVYFYLGVTMRIFSMRMRDFVFWCFSCILPRADMVCCSLYSWSWCMFIHWSYMYRLRLSQA